MTGRVVTAVVSGVCSEAKAKGREEEGEQKFQQVPVFGRRCRLENNGSVTSENLIIYTHLLII